MGKYLTPDLTLRVNAHVNLDEQRAAPGAAFGPTPMIGRFPLDSSHMRPPTTHSEAPARMRSRMRAAHTASLADALNRTMAELIGCITDKDRREYKPKLDKDFRTLLHGAAAARTGETGNTPLRTRT